MQDIALTVDIVLFRSRQDGTEVLLIQRKNDPFKGQWALPGGFVETDEPLDVAALRDPRQRVVTIAYYSVLKEDQDIKADTDASDARWFDLDELPKLAFDHSSILLKSLSLYNS